MKFLPFAFLPSGSFRFHNEYWQTWTVGWKHDPDVNECTPLSTSVRAFAHARSEVASDAPENVWFTLHLLRYRFVIVALSRARAISELDTTYKI